MNANIVFPFLGSASGLSKEQNNEGFRILVRVVRKSEACTINMVLGGNLEQLLILCSLLIVLVHIGWCVCMGCMCSCTLYDLQSVIP
jgi:hypothetical protein